ncbi:MAG: hypothetical protein E7C70_10080 [Ruminococcus sp.]|nr:hypothetical protein [Ruminococcus sp.]
MKPVNSGVCIKIHIFHVFQLFFCQHFFYVALASPLDFDSQIFSVFFNSELMFWFVFVFGIAGGEFFIDIENYPVDSGIFVFCPFDCVFQVLFFG